MPDFQIRVNATRTGPFRDGRFQRAASQYSDAVQYAVAEHGEKLVVTRLNQVLKKQTPYYRTRITVKRGRGGYMVTDQGVIYGPWLEGTGSRNAPVTRFRGYATFRRVKPIVDRDANRIAIQLLNRYQARGLLR
jgi:hypothetical protein